MKLKWLIYTTLILVILSGCISTPIQALPTIIADTVTPKISPTAQPTNTPSSTNTPEIKTHILDESVSPDGLWNAMIIRTIQGENYNIKFTVLNNFGDQTWVIENLDFKEPEPLVGYHYPYIFKWSDNGKYLYYSHLTTGGDGCYVPSRPGGFDLRRVDLLSGEDVVIQEEGGTWLALSPDESKLAYVQGWDGNVTLLNIENQIEQIIPLPPITDVYGLVDTTDYIFWSPDGNSFVYAFLWGDCGDYFFSYIMHFDINTQKQTVLINHDEHGYIPVEWKEQDKILLLDNADNNWWLNPIKKEIIPTKPNEPPS